MKKFLISIKNIKHGKNKSSKTLMAGAARVDITPPPGIPMSGHSLNGCCGAGVRTRLSARVIYIRSGEGNSVALAVCDLLSGSRILHHRIAELISSETDISAEGLVLSGTHTHSGPGNYFGSNFYNKFASNDAGFDPKLFDFLSSRIAKAVISAFKNKRQAKIAIGTTELWNVTRNRSIKAYLRNRNITAKDKFDSVNPILHMIRIDCKNQKGGYSPIGAYSNFSIHPNLSNKDMDRLYNGDAFAYIEREVEWGIKQHYQTPWEPVHAAANYTHGDNTPNFRKDMDLGYIEDRRIGIIIGEKAFELFKSLGSKLKSNITVSSSAKEVDILQDRTIDGMSISKRAVVGAALTAGAQDRGRSTIILRSLPFFKPGWARWFFTRSSQGHKRILMGPLQYLYLPRKGFPHNLFVQLIQIGDSVLVPLPFEITYESGMRIAGKTQEACKKSGLSSVQRFIPVSCSNGYFGYVSTPEEYSRQHYEGGHTLYGPGTCEYLASQTAQLAENLSQKININGNLPDTWKFTLKLKEFFPEDITPIGVRKTHSPPDYHEAKGKHEAFWSFKLFDVPPNLIDLHMPLVRIETSMKKRKWKPLIIDGIPVDDSGYDISIMLLDKHSDKNMGLYEIRWHNPVKQDGELYRFAILPRKGQEIYYSPEFR